MEKYATGKANGMPRLPHETLDYNTQVLYPLCYANGKEHLSKLVTIQNPVLQLINPNQ